LGVLLSLAATLAACSSSRSGGASLGAASNESTSAVPAAPANRMAMAGSRAVDAYVMLGGRIKSCWFNADAPLLPNYVYRANVSANGGTVQITIHEREALVRPGLLTYIINFQQEGGYTVVSTDNRKMPPQLAAKMQFDIARWKRGETNCSRAMPSVAAGTPRQ
jgi:hypothetical protein